MNPIDDSPITRDGNSLILAYDHGTEHGPVDFEPMPRSADPTHVFDVGRHDAVTAIALQKGTAEYYRNWEAEHGIQDGAPLLVKVNGNSNLPERDDYYSPTQCSVRYAVKELDADAIGYTMYAGSRHEDRMWREFREVQEDARSYGVPVVMWSYPRGAGIRTDDAYTGQEDPAVVAYGARLGLELGADVVKCKYPGDQAGWRQVEAAVPGLKTVMSGGSRRGGGGLVAAVRPASRAGGSAVVQGAMAAGFAPVGLLGAGWRADVVVQASATARAPPLPGPLADLVDSASGYDGAVADRTGADEVTVGVGAGDGFAYDPAAVRVSPGTTVTWQWTGVGSRHNVVDEGGDFESAYYAAEGATFSREFSSPGVWKYYCTPHRNLGMVGVVEVVDE